MDQVNEPDDDAGAPAATSAETDLFKAMFDQHLPAVWRFARRRCESSADADDVAAETFAVAWRRRADAPPPDEMALWLFGVARRVLANQRRANDRRGQLQLRLVGAAARTPAAPPADHRLNHRTGLAEALASLHPDDRELLLLRAWDGLGIQEIAGLLGCSQNAASIRLHRARGRLARALESGDDTTDRFSPAKEPTTSRTSPGRPTNPKEETP
jgi:RNA polymerase sigma-70 factor (ECF subfamily)